MSVKKMPGGGGAKTKGLPPPRHLLWELTLRCNCRCTHCAASAGRPRADELDTSEALEVCGQIARLGVESVCFMGGEALLRPDWERLASRLRQEGVAFLGVVTNGIALDAEAFRRLDELSFCQVVVSLDSFNPDVHDARRRHKGAHAAALSAIVEMGNHDLATRTVVTSVDRSTLGELSAMRDLLGERAPFVDWYINTSSPTAESRMSRSDALDEEDLIFLANFLAETRATGLGPRLVSGTHSLGYASLTLPDLHAFEWAGCQAGLSTLGLRSDGTVVGCLIMSDAFIEGSLRQRSLFEIWNDPNGFGYNRRFSVDLLTGRCRGCDEGEWCRGGCRQAAQSMTGSPFEMAFCLHRLERAGRVLVRHER